MTFNDLIVAAPWITFGAGLSAVCIRLLRSGRRSGPQPGRSPRLPQTRRPRRSRTRAAAARPGLPAAPRRGSAGGNGQPPL